MKPHEVIKESLENFEVEYPVTKFASALRGMSFQMELRRDFKKTIIDSQLSLLLSVKEVVDKMKENNYCDNHELCDGCCGSHCCDVGYDKAKSDFQLLLDEEINKIKELN